MISQLENLLRQHWGVVAPGPAPQQLAFLKLGLEEYPEPEVPLLFLAFADAGKTPCAVAKVARDAAGDAAVGAEVAALEKLQSLPADMRAMVPALLHAGRVNGRAALLMTALPGAVELHHTWSAGRARTHGELILSALSWALKLAQTLPAPALRLGEWSDAANGATWVEAAAAPGWERDHTRLLEERLQEAGETQWPAGFAHGDYFPGNLLFQGPQLCGVVDWAMASQRQPLFFDVLTYEFSFCAQLARQGITPHASSLQVVHAMPPFAAMRQRLAASGICLELGSVPRLATLLALIGAARACGRERMARSFLRVLAAELQAASAGEARP